MRTTKATGRSPADSRQAGRPRAAQLFYLFLLFAFLFLTISIISFNSEEAPGSDFEGRSSGWLGQVGAAVAYFFIVGTFGRWGALALPAALGFALVGRFSRRRFRSGKWIVAALVTGFYLGFGTALGRHFGDLPQDVIRSGALPLRVAEISLYYLYGLGTVLLGGAVLAAFAVSLFNFPLTEGFELFFYRLPARTFQGLRSLFSGGVADQGEEVELEDEELDQPSRQQPDSSFGRMKQPPGQAAPSRPLPLAAAISIANEGAVAVTIGIRELPPLRLLDPTPAAREALNSAELEENSRRLEEKLASLGVIARVVKTNPGPVITRYDLEPSAEVKVSRIAGLSDDIAMALRARGIRILAPIPGEAAVGIEIPNRYPEMVFVRDVLASAEFRAARAPLTVALGKDAEGRIFLADLARMPHLLVAGATGSGKSVCINVILLSLLYRSDPQNVRVVLIDPKKLELSLYARLAQQHLVTLRGLGEDVITTPENAVLALRSVHAEMERRTNTLAEVGVRGLEEYNRWRVLHPADVGGTDRRRPLLPYLVVIIDELADLMMSVRREFEELVVRLAQMSRAVGIHLVIATQRPSVDVITGLIKANFPARIAFQMASRADSRTIIDGNGAESLLGRGDMLFQSPGGGSLLRVHGALATTEEVERVVEFIGSQPPVSDEFQLPDPEAARIKVGSVESVTGTGSTDELFEEAARIVVRVEQGSISILQRRLRIGYSRAARLIDELEQAGIVGPFDGSKARQVMATPEELRERYGIEP